MTSFSARKLLDALRMYLTVAHTCHVFSYKLNSCLLRSKTLISALTTLLLQAKKLISAH